MFSNLQFSPFSANTQPSTTNTNSQHVYQQLSPQHVSTHEQHHQSSVYLSTSLPASSHGFESIETQLNTNLNQHLATQQQYNTSENHPNLNKLLLRTDQTQSKLTPVLANNFNTTKTLKGLKSSPGKKAPNTKEKVIKRQQEATSTLKKRQQKKRDIYEDSDEESDDSDTCYSDDNESQISRSKSSKSAINKLTKMEDNSDFDDDDDENSSDDDDDLNTTRNSITSSQSVCHSGASSFVNSESLFDLMMSSKNRDAYFWQYNIQSKGPKTKKVLTLRNKDPHLHRDFFDPVFQLQSLNARGGTAVNKLRKGDGNDVTPNAEKLYNLGNQIKDFIQKSYQMNNACFSPPPPSISSSSLNQLSNTPISSSLGILGTSVDSAIPKERVNLKREKNKIASRACRLKKKAQHEANKIKLYGLNDEHSKKD